MRPVEQLHDGALPRAVAAEEADALAALDAEIGAVEHGRSAEGDAEGAEGEEGHELEKLVGVVDHPEASGASARDRARGFRRPWGCHGGDADDSLRARA